MTDFMVTEAVTLRVHAEDRKAEEEEERKKWKGNSDHLKNIG